MFAFVLFVHVLFITVLLGHEHYMPGFSFCQYFFEGGCTDGTREAAWCGREVFAPTKSKQINWNLEVTRSLPSVILSEAKDLVLCPFTQEVRTRFFVAMLLRMTREN